MDIKKLLPATLMAASVMLTAQAQAESYIGLSFGSADYSGGNQVGDELLSSAQSVATITDSSSTVVTSDSSSQFVYGYKFSPSFAVELSYNDLGTVGVDGTINAGTTGTVAYDVSGDISSIGLSAVYWISTESSTQPFVKLGYHSWDMDGNSVVTASGTLSGSSTQTTTNDTDSGTDLLWGLGLDIGLSESLALRVEYESFDLGSGTLTDDVSVISAGLKYKF